MRNAYKNICSEKYDVGKTLDGMSKYYRKIGISPPSQKSRREVVLLLTVSNSLTCVHKVKKTMLIVKNKRRGGFDLCPSDSNC